MDATAVDGFTPPALYRKADFSGVTALDIEFALKRLRAANPATEFIKGAPSAMPGLIKLTLEGGKLAYTDKSGRYLIVGVIFDMALSRALDGALDAKAPNENGENEND
jgi:hypothetical protein